MADDTPAVGYIDWQRLNLRTCHDRLSLTEVNWLEPACASVSPACSDIPEVRAVVGL